MRMRLLVIWLHLLAVVVWIGGILQQSLVWLPAARAHGANEFVAAACRARPLAWTAVSIVVLTGFYNVTQLGPLGPLMQSGAALALAGKFILVIAAVALAGQRDFAQLPRAQALLAAGQRPTPALSAMAWLDRLVLVLAAAIMYLGLALSRLPS
jgi:copper resistance protein D